MSSITHNSIETESILAALKQRITELEAQTKREWVGLTDADVNKIKATVWGMAGIIPQGATVFARQIEAKLKEKNQ